VAHLWQMQDPVVRMPNVRFAAALVAFGFLAGCNHNSLAVAQQRYSECLKENEATPDRCEAQRQAYEAEFVHLRPFSGFRPIFQRR